MTFFEYWALITAIALTLVAYMYYTKNYLLKNRGELVGIILLSIIPLINVSAVLVALFCVLHDMGVPVGLKKWMAKPIHSVDRPGHR